MRKLLLLLATIAVLSLPMLAAAQPTQADIDRAKRADSIVDKIYQLDLLNQILPLLLTKEQYRKILPEVEKARQKVREQQKLELQELIKVEGKLNDEIKRGSEKGEVPSKETLQEVFKTLYSLRMTRSFIAQENTENVLKVFRSTLNAGQLKAAANSLNPKEIDPTVDVTKMAEEEKIRFYVREIILHPLAYDVMYKLSLRE